MKKQTKQTTLYPDKPYFKSNEQILMDFIAHPIDLKFSSQKEFYNYIYDQLLSKSITPISNHQVKEEFKQIQIKIANKKILILPVQSNIALRAMELQNLILPIDKLKWNLIIVIVNQDYPERLIHTADRLRVILFHHSLFMSFFQDLIINTQKEFEQQT